MCITLHETSIFFQILEKILPNTLFYETFDTYIDITNNQRKHIDYLNQSFMNNFKHKQVTIAMKYRFLKEFQNNPFVTIEKKNELLNFFCLAQKVTFGFYKFLRLLRLKKSKEYEFECDLCLEPLSTLNPKFVVPIIQRNRLYKFRIHDLIRLVQNGLVYAPDLFSEPQAAKNPHTNLPFSVTDLYNIYFHILKADMKMPIMFKMYFLSNFDMTMLLDKYESVLRDESIRCNLKGMDKDDKYDEIMDMVDKYKRVMPSICIDTRFSSDKLVEGFEHTLIHFLYSKYSYNPAFRLKHKTVLMIQLKKMNSETPTFGRVFVRLRRNIMSELRTPSLFTSTNDVAYPHAMLDNRNSFNSNLLEVMANIDNNQHIVNNSPLAITNTSTSTTISTEDSEMDSVIENDDDDDHDENEIVPLIENDIDLLIETDINVLINNDMDSFVDTLLNHAGLTVVGERIVSNSGRSFVNVPPINENVLEPLPYPLEPIERLTQLAHLAQVEIDNNIELDSISREINEVDMDYETDTISEINLSTISNQPYDEASDDFSDIDDMMSVDADARAAADAIDTDDDSINAT